MAEVFKEAGRIALRAVQALAGVLNMLSTNGTTGNVAPPLTPPSKPRDEYRP